jgi:hypothetical protein
MARLNQVVAVVAGKKSDAEKQVTDIYHKVQKPALFEGISKRYETIAAEGEELPPEQKQMQLRVSDVVAQFRAALSPVLDTTLTQDVANCTAKADVVVDGTPVLRDVPVTYLLFLEKKLTDLNAFISRLPTLDPAQPWTYSADAGCYQTPESWKYHTKKVPVILTLSPATDKHPAQTQLLQEDRNVGRWKTVSFSGAIPVSEQQDMLARVKKLIEAVKTAREAANLLEVENKRSAGPIFDFVFGPAA